MGNGATLHAIGLTIEAVPAYNNRQPKGRANGYVLTLGGMRFYMSGDTGATDEMRALTDIDVAFVCMNLPFTMDASQAADAVSEFQPAFVYPYHYRGRDGGTQDPKEFASLLGETDAETEVRIGDWYNPDVI